MNRVWTYIISKDLDAGTLQKIQDEGNAFVNAWTAHENKLTATFELIKNKIIVVRVNEDINSASGCSIDKLTRFIKHLEQTFAIELLNRLLVAYKADDKIVSVHSSKISDLLKQEVISENTVVYNTSVATENELQNWETPLKETWLKKYLQTV